MAVPPDGGGWQPAKNLLLTEGRQLKSRFRRKADLGKPTRCVTAYDVFFRNTYTWLKQNRRDLNQQQLFAEVGRLWREATTWQDRQICYDYADWEKETYDVAMKAYSARREKLKERQVKMKEDGHDQQGRRRREGDDECKIM